MSSLRKISLLLSIVLFAAVAAELQLPDNYFQLDFLKELKTSAEQTASRVLNNHLARLQSNARYESYKSELTAAMQASRLQPKVLLIKQLADATSQELSMPEQVQRNLLLRNLHFLRTLKLQLTMLQDASAAELRQTRVNTLCKQFRPPTEPAAEQTKLVSEQVICAAIKQANWAGDETSETEHTSNATSGFDLSKFGAQLYERVKLPCAETINNYLLMLRMPLQEVIDEKEDYLEPAEKIRKILQEIDAMLAIKDLYAKRERLYAYLERNLATDYEQFRNTQDAQRDLTEIIEKLKSKGVDVFVMFLFSNFEFLEHVHEELAQALHKLPEPQSSRQARVLFEVQHKYECLKRDTENKSKYDGYVEQLSILAKEAATSAGGSHVFELLHNAAQNVGSVTFNMIKAKCLEQF